MTAINIAIAGRTPDAEQKRVLVDRITEAFALVEVGNDSPQIRRGFMTSFSVLNSDDLWKGTDRVVDTSDAACGILVTVRVMAGPWNSKMKNELFSHVDTILRDVLSIDSGDGSEVWMTFVEVPEGGWGVGANAVSIGAIAPVFAADRQARIQSYLESAP